MSIKSLRILLIVGMVLALALLVFQINNFSTLKKEHDEKKERLAQLRVLQTTLAHIEGQLAQRKFQEDKLFKKVAKGTGSVFDLMKDLASIGTEMGLRNISFGIEDIPEAVRQQQQQQQGRRRQSMRRIDVRNEKIKPLILSDEVDRRYFTMGCSAEYPTLIAFIKRLHEHDRIILVERVEVQRQEGILPRQKITLSLMTYTFSFTQ